MQLSSLTVHCDLIRREMIPIGPDLIRWTLKETRSNSRYFPLDVKEEENSHVVNYVQRRVVSRS